MPKRQERLFWVHTSPLDGNRASSITDINLDFSQRTGSSCIECVSTPEISDRLWLFKLQVNAQPEATQFNKELKTHMEEIKDRFGEEKLKIKRQTSLPQPLVCDRLGPWPITDVGLHSVNDEYNAMLVSYTYHEGRLYHIPHLQLSTMKNVAKRLEDTWRSVVCSCHATSSCCGFGCFDCFKPDCPNCDGTGWKDYVTWANNGYRVNYKTKVPIAVVT